MEVERLVTKLVVDASEYTGPLAKFESDLQRTVGRVSSSLGGILDSRKIGSGVTKLGKDFRNVTNSIQNDVQRTITKVRSLSDTKAGRGVKWLKEDTKVGRGVMWAEHKAFFAAHLTREAAVEAAARRKGLDEAAKAKLASRLSAGDFVGGYGTGAAALSMFGPYAGKAAMFLPSVSAAHLGYSAIRNPKATFGAVKDTIAHHIPSNPFRRGERPVQLTEKDYHPDHKFLDHIDRRNKRQQSLFGRLSNPANWGNSAGSLPPGGGGGRSLGSGMGGGRGMGGGGLGGLSALGGAGGPAGFIAAFAVTKLIGGAWDLVTGAISTAVDVLRTFTEYAFSAAKYAFNLGVEFERTATMFEVMTGSAEKGKALFADVRKLAVETPFTTKSLAKGAEQLLGYGMDSSNIIPALSRIGDIASGDTEKMKRLTLAVGQVFTAGRFLGSERRQFAEAGVGLEDFAKTANMTSGQFLSAMAKGNVGAEVVINTINRLTSAGGRFYQMNARQNKTVGGQVNALTESVENAVGETTEKAFRRYNVADFIGSITAQVAPLKDQVDPLFAWLDKLGPLFRIGQSALKAIVAGIGELGRTIQGSSGTWESFNKFFSWFGENSVTLIGSTADAFLKLGRFISMYVVRPLMFAHDLITKTGILALEAAGQTGPANMLKKEHNQFMDQTKFVLKGIEAAGANPQIGVQMLKAFKNSQAGGDDYKNWSRPLVDGNPRMFEMTKENPFGPDSFRRIPLSVEAKAKEKANMALGGAAGILGLGAPGAPKPMSEPARIDVEIKLSKELEAFGESLSKSIRDGLTPLDQFRTTVDKIDQVYRGLPEKANVAFAGFGAAAIPNGIGDKARDLGLFNAYKELKKDIGFDKPPDLPKAVFKGTTEAYEIINKSSQEQKDTMKEVVEVLLEANRKRQEMIDEQKRTTDAIKDGIGKGLIVKPGEDK